MQESPEISKLRQDFEAFYNQNLWGRFAAMEEERKKYFIRFCVLFFIMFFILPSLIIWLWGQSLLIIFHNMDSKQTEDAAKISLLIFWGMIAITGSPIFAFRKKIKTKIMQEFVRFFGTFKYCFEQRIDSEILRKSLLFGGFNSNSGDDYFTGTYKNVRMTIAEQKLVYQGRKNSHTEFKGILILLDMNKNFQGQTVVFNDYGVFNFLHRFSNLGAGLQNIKLEDVVFEKQFEVYGTNQIEARYLLTPAFMERILQVCKLFQGSKVKFGFFDNRLLIAVSTGKNMFETSSLFSITTNRKRINQTFEQILSVMSVVDILKLTQK